MNNKYHNKVRLIKRINIKLKLSIDPLTNSVSTNLYTCLLLNKTTTYKVTQIVTFSSNKYNHIDTIL